MRSMKSRCQVCEIWSDKWRKISLISSLRSVRTMLTMLLCILSAHVLKLLLLRWSFQTWKIRPMLNILNKRLHFRIPEIVWICFLDYGTIWWKIFFVGSLLYRDSVGRGRTGKERVRCKLWLISMHIPLISVSFGGKCRKLPFDYFPHKLAIVKN